MTAGTLFFGYINYRGIGFAGALQLILAFMLTFGILALFGGVLTLDTASVANLSPAFSDKRSMIACVLLVFAISLPSCSWASIPCPRLLKNSPSILPVPATSWSSPSSAACSCTPW